LLADLVGDILTNGKAGLIDLNLVKKQKLLRASASVYTLIDYGILYMNGSPSMGQSLEEVQSLMLGEIENLKKGNFDEDLITSIVNNLKKQKIQESEKYSSRASSLMDAFCDELDWQSEVAYVDQLSKLTKKEIVAFANKYFGDNYVAVFKRKGEDKSIVKVEKPPITPVETNSKEQSMFVRTVNEMPSSPVKPVWLDYSKDINKSKIGAAEVLHVKNNDNSLFRLRYRFDVGSWNNKKLAVAAQYLQFLGTPDMTSEQITKEFYKIACSFNVSAGSEFTVVTIEGLQENFDKAVSLFEKLINNCQPDEEALKSMKARVMKSRTDAKSNKGQIMNGLSAYARYGAKNPFNYTMSNAEIEAMTAKELTDMLHEMGQYAHKILYYGPLEMNELTGSLSKMHPIPASFKMAPEKEKFSYSEQTKNRVFFADYKMVQAEIRWIRNTSPYDPAEEPVVNMFNNYFGGGMSTVVFQTIRESKALAYSTFAVYVTPDKKEDPFYAVAYVGCQSDKFNESVAAMNELLTELPENEKNIESAKSGIKKDIETERIVQDAIIFNYLGAQRKGLNTDTRKNMYESIDKFNYNDLKVFHAKHIANKPFSYAILASADKVKMEDMEKIGEVTKLNLEEIFGY